MKLMRVLVISVITLMYISLVYLLPYSTLYKIYVPANLLFLLILLLVNKNMKLQSIGITSKNLLNSLIFGISVAVLTLIPIILFIFFNRDIAIDDPRLVQFSSPLMLIYTVFIHILLGTAIFEEIIHRGIILTEFLKLTNTIYAVLLSSLVFAAWHIVSTIRLIWPTIISNANSDVLKYSLLISPFILYFFGGLLFSWIRLHTKNIAGSIVAHWLINSSVLLTYYLIR